MPCWTPASGSEADVIVGPEVTMPGAVDPEEISHEQQEAAGLSQGQLVRRRFLRHKGAMAALVLLIFIVLLATTSIGWGPIPGWSKYDSSSVVPPNPDQSPTMSLRPTWLGGDGVRFGDHPF